MHLVFLRAVCEQARNIRVCQQSFLARASDPENCRLHCASFLQTVRTTESQHFGPSRLVCSFYTLILHDFAIFFLGDKWGAKRLGPRCFRMQLQWICSQSSLYLLTCPTMFEKPWRSWGSKNWPTPKFLFMFCHMFSCIFSRRIGGKILQDVPIFGCWTYFQ